MTNIKDWLRDINELVMFKHSIFSLPFIFISMIVAADGWFGWSLLVLGVLAALSARNFAMAVNRYLDRDIDAKNPRTQSRPSVDGRMSADSVLVFAVANALVFIFVAYLINTLAFMLSIPILVLLGAYSYFKRFSSMAHVILGLSLGLAPIAGVVAVEATITLWSILLALGVTLWVAGFDLLYSLQDMDFDEKMGLFSIPSQYGSNTALLLAKIFHAQSIIFWVLFVMSAELGFFAYLAVIVSATMLWYEHRLVDKDFSKIDRAFFTVNGYLGVIFLFLIILEKAF